jgi:hypothetical protein
VAGIGYSYIRLNGEDLLAQYSRGLDVAVLDANFKSLVTTGTFDTFIQSDASANMVSFINAQAAGSLFIVVAQDEATNLMTTDLKYTVGQDFGAALFSSLGYANSYVMIGVKGALNPLVEQSSATTTVQLSYCLSSGKLQLILNVRYADEFAVSSTTSPSAGAIHITRTLQLHTVVCILFLCGIERITFSCAHFLNCRLSLVSTIPLWQRNEDI